MKKIDYLLVILFLFIACKKDSPNDLSISGKWEWYKTYSTGIRAPGTPGSWTPQSTGRSWTLILNPDLTFTRSGDFPSSIGMANIETGSYSLAHVQQINSSQIGGEICIQYILCGTFMKNSQDTLMLEQNLAADGIAHFFVRK